MLNNPLEPDIRALIDAKDFATLKAALSGMEVHDLAALLVELEPDELPVCFRLLPLSLAAEIMGDFGPDQQEDLLNQLSSDKMVAILNDMPPDDRTMLLEELPGEVAQRLLVGLRGEQLKIARSLLAYPEDSIGRLMTPQYVVVRPDWTVEQVFAHLRKVAPTKETLNIVYVVSERSRLLDEIRLEQFVLAEPSQRVEDLMDNQVVTLHALDDQEEAVETFKKYDALALPVVNSEGILVGIVTFDDVMDVVEEEDTEDFHKMAGVGALEDGYFQTSYVQMLSKRLPWLALLFLAEMVTVATIRAFEASHDAALMVMVMTFVPLINACAGNTGSQVSGLMIRGLAVLEMDLSDWPRILGLELARGLTMGIVLGLLACPAVLLFGGTLSLAVAATLAMAIAVTFANVIGSALPLLFKRIGVDPATTSGPFIASVMDVASVFIYFLIALPMRGLFQGVFE